MPLHSKLSAGALSTPSAPRGKSNSTAANTAALFVYAAVALRNGRKSSGRRAGRRLRAIGKQEGANARTGQQGLKAVGQQELVATSNKEKEAEELMRQAAALRESISELEAEKSEFEKHEQYKLFQQFDVNGKGIGVEELQKGWEEVQGKPLDRVMAVNLVDKFDSNKNGVLEFDEFDMKELQASLDKLLVHREVERVASEKAEEKRLAKLEMEQKLKEYNETLPGNDDTGLLTRIGSVVAYGLPILDAARLGLPIAIMLNFLLGADGLIHALDALIVAGNAIPFASLILYLIIQWISDQEELPALLRYNLKQAALLDIAIAFPALLADASGLLPDQAVASQIWVVLHSIGFLAICGCAFYSMASSVLGIAPRSIPWVSANAVKGIAGEPPSLDDDAQPQASA